MNSKYLLTEGENKRLYYHNAHLSPPQMTVNIHNQKYFFPLATTIYKESLSIILYSSPLLNRNTLFPQVHMWAEETCQIRNVPGWSYFKLYFLFIFLFGLHLPQEQRKLSQPKPVSSSECQPYPLKCST